MSHVCSMNFTPCSTKIADGLTESDTDPHFLDISAYVPRNCVAVVILVNRTTGDGYLYLYPNEDTSPLFMCSSLADCYVVALVENTQRMKYALSVANDVFDVFLVGYWVEGRIM